MHSLQMKIFALVMVLLVLIQSVSLFTLYQRVQEDAEHSLTERLQAGGQVFLNQFDARRQSLAIYSTTLSKDFGLLEAFHQGAKSLLVALDKRRRQVGADTAVVVDMKGVIRADTGRPGLAGAQFELASDAVPYASTHPLFMDLSGTDYELVAAPLKAPNRVGWVLLGFKLDAPLAQRFATFTSLQVTFLEQTPDGRWRMLASTLPDAARASLSQAPEPRAGAQALGDETYLGLSLPLAGAPGRPVVALLQGAEREAFAAFESWWQQIVEVFMGGLLLALLGAWLLARSVARPLRLLVEHAGSIEAGNYAEPITVRQHGEVGELVDKFNRMQQAIVEREASIRRHAQFDPLTGLANRFRLEEIIQESITQIDTGGPRLGVLIAGLDRFKDINDNLGYEAGDQLLRLVATRLQESVASQDVVGRIGGDEFGILLRDAHMQGIRARLDQVAAAFASPFQIEGMSLHLSAGIGLASHPGHGRDAATLLRHADRAKWTAKQKRLRYAIYDGAQDRYSLLRLGLLGELRSAIEHNDLVLHYQPKVALAKGQLAGAEALLRWQHPVYGLIPPAEFIPMVEHTGNISLITGWALRTACAQAQAWRQAGMEVRVAVNVSAYDLRNPEFVDDVERLISKQEADPSLLSLEITEGAVMEDVDQAIMVFERFREHGISLSIDDYGTGYSSMAQLKRLPVDELKIDKSFVLALDSSEDDEIIVRSTIELGHNMGLKVVGEGVESRGGLEMLRKLRCDIAQGHYISRSLPSEKFTAWWQSGAWRAALESH